jgi:hypothetical protein
MMTMTAFWDIAQCSFVVVDKSKVLTNPIAYMPEPLL